MTHSGARGTQNPFKFQTGDHVGTGLVVVYIFQMGRIIGFAAGAKNHGTNLQLNDFFLLAMIDGIRQTGIHTLVALTAITTV